MLNFRKSLKEQEEILMRAEEVISAEMEKLPDGKVHCCKTRYGFKYYYKAAKNETLLQKMDGAASEHKTDPPWVYLPVSKINLAKSLAQKEYYQKIHPLISKTLRIIRQLDRIYESDELENVYGKLSPGRKALVKPLFRPMEDLIKKWENIQYEPKPFAEGQKEYITMHGERVRSKSEKIIADELYVKGIPYLYEYPINLKVDGRLVEFRPDFIVLNKRVGHRYIIEHLGKMDDIGYYNGTLRKLDAFEQNNLLIGRDVLLFHESQARPLNVMVVRQYIQEYLI